MALAIGVELEERQVEHQPVAQTVNPTMAPTDLVDRPITPEP